MAMVIVCAFAALGVLLGTVLLAGRRFSNAVSELPLSAEWIEELSIEKYKPMMRLLSRRDLDLMRTKPGFKPGMAAQFRQQRAQLFSTYLRSLDSDFKRICAAIRLLMVNSSYDRPDLAITLMKSQITFALATSVLNLRLFFYRLGWCEGDAAELIAIFDSMRLELKRLVPATAGAAA